MRDPRQNKNFKGFASFSLFPFYLPFWCYETLSSPLRGSPTPSPAASTHAQARVHQRGHQYEIVTDWFGFKQESTALCLSRLEIVSVSEGLSGATFCRFAGFYACLTAKQNFYLVQLFVLREWAITGQRSEGLAKGFFSTIPTSAK